MVDAVADAAAAAQVAAVPQQPPPPLAASFASSTPGPTPHARRTRWAGPSWVTWLFVIFIVTAYAWTLRPVASEHAPGAAWKWNLARASFAVCAVVGLVCLWVTAAADPGFIKPRLTPDLEYASVATGRVSGESLGWRLDGVGQWLRADGSRFCTTCHVWRPRLAAHCGECGHCVTRHDHHCGVMGTCVAQRNHAPFAGFLCAAVAGSVILFAATAAQLYAMKFPWTAGSWRRWETYPHAVLLVFYLFPCFMQGFAAMHVLFLFRDMTTNEMIKARRRRTAAVLAGGAAPEPEPPVVVDRSSSRVFCLEFRSRRAFEEAWAAMQQQLQPQAAMPALPAADGDTAALPA